MNKVAARQSNRLGVLSTISTPCDITKGRFPQPCSFSSRWNLLHRLPPPLARVSFTKTNRQPEELGLVEMLLLNHRELGKARWNGLAPKKTNNITNLWARRCNAVWHTADYKIKCNAPELEIWPGSILPIRLNCEKILARPKTCNHSSLEYPVENTHHLELLMSFGAKLGISGTVRSCFFLFFVFFLYFFWLAGEGRVLV